MVMGLVYYIGKKFSSGLLILLLNVFFFIFLTASCRYHGSVSHVFYSIIFSDHDDFLIPRKLLGAPYVYVYVSLFSFPVYHELGLLT